MATLNIKDHISNEYWKPITTAFLREHNILEEEKIQIIEHPASTKKIIGAKMSGKTIVAKADEFIFMENNPLGCTLDGRKQKDQASEKLGGYFHRFIKMCIQMGYKPRYNYEKKRLRTYSLKDKRNMMNNSYQQYFSLEDVDGTDGMAPENLGFYGRMHIDEPIIRADMLNPDKIPDKEKFKADMDQIDSNIARFTDDFVKYYGKTPPGLVKWFTMNDWGKHPMTVAFNDKFPQTRFIKHITGHELDTLLYNKELIIKLTKPRTENGNILDSEWADLWLKNHTLSVYDEEEDELLVRMTIFANPNKRNEKRVLGSANKKGTKFYLEKIAEGFLKGNWRLLAFYSGLQFEAQPESDLLVYNINSFNETTLQSLIKEQWIPLKLSYGIDIDTTRVNTITPTWYLEKHTRAFGGKWKKTKALFIDKQIELKAMGNGDFGEMHEIYAKQMALMIKKHFLKSLKIKEVDFNLEKTFCVVDDNRKHYIKELKNTNMLNGYIETFMGAVKQGHYEIIERQDYVETSYAKGILHTHKANKPLMDDFKSCVKASPNITTRTTAGTINYLDRIDSAEYSLYPFITTMVQSGKAKKIKMERKLN